MFAGGKETMFNIKVAGREFWTVSRFTPSILEKIIGFVKREFGDPFAGLDKLLPALPKEQADAIWAEAKARHETLATMDYTDPLVKRFLLPEMVDGKVQGNVRGLLHTFCFMLQKHQLGTDIDQAAEVMAAVGLPAVLQAITDAMGSMEGNVGAPVVGPAQDLGPTGTTSSGRSFTPSA